MTDTLTSTDISDTDTFDADRAEVFAGRMVSLLNDASLSLLVSIGHQVGLFDAMAGLPPSTSDEIAAAAGLEERYVREWLGAMTTGRIVEHDPGTTTFHLPPEHARSVTRAAGPGNLAAQAQFIPMLAAVEAPIIECFRRGGGVPYSEYGAFHRLMAEDSGAVLDAALLEGIVPLVPGLPERLAAGIDVADVGCGSGHAVNLLAQAFPASRCAGYDISEEAIGAARREAEQLGLPNARFEVRDVADLGEIEAFDLVLAFDAIHDQAHPADVLAGVARALRPGGTFLMVDIKAASDVAGNLDHPLGPFLYSVSTLHCMTVSLSQGGDGLGTVWGEELALQMLADAGFTSVEVADVAEDIVNAYYVARKAEG